MHKISNVEYLKFKASKGVGYSPQRHKGIVRVSNGINRNNSLLLFAGWFTSLLINFIASAKGISSPLTLGLFGPFRDCKCPRMTRSNSVKNATLSRTKRICIRKLVQILTISFFIFKIKSLVKYKSFYRDRYKAVISSADFSTLSKIYPRT